MLPQSFGLTSGGTLRSFAAPDIQTSRATEQNSQNLSRKKGLGYDIERRAAEIPWPALTQALRAPRRAQQTMRHQRPHPALRLRRLHPRLPRRPYPAATVGPSARSREQPREGVPAISTRSSSRAINKEEEASSQIERSIPALLINMTASFPGTNFTRASANSAFKTVLAPSPMPTVQRVEPARLPRDIDSDLGQCQNRDMSKSQAGSYVLLTMVMTIPLLNLLALMRLVS